MSVALGMVAVATELIVEAVLLVALWLAVLMTATTCARLPQSSPLLVA